MTNLSHYAEQITEEYDEPTIVDEKSTIDKVSEILDAMKDLLKYKNAKYGDSALNPNNIFYKGSATNSILIRLDDKIGRIRNRKSEEVSVNDVADIIGYCTLLLASMDVGKKDIEKFKDWRIVSLIQRCDKISSIIETMINQIKKFS